MTDDKTVRAGPPAGEEMYAEEILSTTLMLRDMFLSYKNEVRKERISLGTRLDRILLDILETYDGLAGYVRQYEGHNAEGYERVRTIYIDLQQKLERAGVTPLRVEDGELFDEARHEIVNLSTRPRDWEGRPSIARVTTPGYFLNNKVLRRAGVEVNWVPKGNPRAGSPGR